MISESGKKSVTFYCFTPLVSLATFAIEFFFALYILTKYRQTFFSQLCVAIMLCLAFFQLAEYGICKMSYTEIWIKVGVVSITLLPVLAINIISVITKKYISLSLVGYGIASLFIGAILFVPEIALQAHCMPHYVEIRGHWLYEVLYRLYYVSFLLIGISILLYSLQKKNGDIRQLRWMLGAYGVFFIPAIILYLVNAVTHNALPSIMCGFAIVAACIFIFAIIPRYYKLLGKKKNQKNKKR